MVINLYWSFTDMYSLYKKSILARDCGNINFFLGVKIYKFVKIIYNRETLQSTL